MKVKDESERTILRLNIKNNNNNKIMASSPITAWQIEGENVEVVTEFLLGAPKSLLMVTAAMKSGDNCLLARK